MSEPLCQSHGPRGVRCDRPLGHPGNCHATVEDEGRGGPPRGCDVCPAVAGVNCADPAACALVRVFRASMFTADDDAVAEA